MPRNVYFSQGSLNEQHMFEDIMIETLQIYGQEVYYLPRKILTRDMILNEDRESQFDDAYMVEMYPEDIEGFGGDGNLMSKFGLEIRDEVTFIVARRSWNKLVGKWNNTVENFRPNEGDLVYLPLSQSMFEISFVEHEAPFYQLNNLTVFKLQCRLFEYNDEDFRTGVEGLDAIEEVHGDILSMLIRDITGDIVLGKRLYQFFPSTNYLTAKNRKVALPGLIATKQALIDSTNNAITAKQSQLDTSTASVTNLNGQIAAVSASITTTQNTINTLNTQLSSMSPDNPQYGSLQSQLGSAQSQLSGYQSQLSSLNSNLATAEANVTTYTSELVALNTTLANTTSEKAILDAELAGIDVIITDAFILMPYVSGIVTEQDQVGNTNTQRTIYLTDIETNGTVVKEFYLSTVADEYTYLVDSNTQDGYETPAVKAELYEIYDLDDDTDRTFENDDAAQNFDFEKEADGFIDFSETNPFGDAS